jgi:hypothetical protein
MTIVHTYSGLAFDVVNVDPDKILLEDIAHALSMQCRFNGHVKRFYSVAEHCYHGAALAAGHGLWVQRDFLLHDAAEAYLGDMVSPIKERALGMEYCRLEFPLQQAIYRKFNAGGGDREAVHKVDRLMCAIEADELMRHPLTGKWPSEVGEDLPVNTLGWLGDPPEVAKRKFLDMAELLEVV